MYAPFMFDTSEQDIRFVLLHEKGSSAYPLHWHKEIEITYALKGSFDVLVNGEKYTIEEGDAVIINSGMSHFYSPNEAELLTAIFPLDIVRDSSGSTALEEDIKERLSRNSRTTQGWIYGDKEKVGRIMQRLDGIPEDSFGRTLVIRAGIFELLYLFADSGHNPSSLEIVTPDDKEEEKIKERIEKVFKYIEENCHRQLTLPEVAEISGYVPTYFARVFKNYTGMTFYDYFTTYRMSKAQVALIWGDESIAEVATKCGFNSVKTFDRVFKENFGVSPLKYRKKYEK